MLDFRYTDEGRVASKELHDAYTAANAAFLAMPDDRSAAEYTAAARKVDEAWLRWSKGPKPTDSYLAAACYEYAVDHYEEHGLDTIVECFSNEELAQLIHGAKTVRGAIRKMLAWSKVRHAYAEDIRATAF